MTGKPTPLTKSGLTRLAEELAHLRNTRRPEVAGRIRQAKELASTQNNADYNDAKNEQAMVEGRILTLEKMIQTAAVIDEDGARRSDSVRLGSLVSILGPGDRSQDFTIVGPAEASPARGRISNESPVGRALLGKRAGEVVQVMAPSGIVRFTITAVR
ncbi:MAG: transcription elongation factor GreA [Dehalococcoidia bacterium]